MYTSSILELYNTPKLLENSTWNPIGVSFVHESQKLYDPRSIFVDRNDTVYVSFAGKGILVMWLKSNISAPRIYYGDHSDTNLSVVLQILEGVWEMFAAFVDAVWQKADFIGWYKAKSDVPNSVFVASISDIYVNNEEKKCIDKWMVNSSKSEIKVDTGESCSGLFVDSNDTLYCSQKKSDSVIKISLKRISDGWEAIVRCTNGWLACFSGSKSIDSPHGLFVDDNFNLYVADSGNNRIRFFEPGNHEGITFFDSNTLVSGTGIRYPTSIILDAARNLYVADTMNHRIIFVSANKYVHRCLIGCKGKPDSNANLLKRPTSISFDSDGNLFVADTENHRVQKFSLTEPLSGTSHTSLCRKLQPVFCVVCSFGLTVLKRSCT